MRYVLLAIFLFSCKGAAEVKDQEFFDSTLVKPLHDSVAKILPVVQKVIEKKQKSIVYQINVLKAENNQLKELTKVTKTVIVRDTIYIKEKTNFWGKKKVSTDSSSSVDSTIIEQ
jgi:microcompartment protein CcmL/EutN